ncbi:hypothetical protein [Marinomonas sp.]|uniref:hypothetical protein n=1 Tax=Marinomonas sp. TaxID=1904862 RepID=UPI003A945E90
MKYRDIQSAHELSVLNSFGSYLSEQGQLLIVVDRPDPPDAIVKINNESCWVEITDAFQSSDWARSLTSYVADDKAYQPYQSRLICEPDNEACEKVREVILKKYDKNSMNSLLNQYGQGVLLVGAYTPLTSLEEIIELAGESILFELASRSSVFKSIYLYRNSSEGHVFAKLL